MRRIHNTGGIQVWRADALDLLRSLDNSSVGLICTDPPYFKVKQEWWDRQWDKPVQFLAWLGEVLDECQRVLRPNGSLYMFASPQMAWAVEGVVRERFNALSRVTWRKPAYSTKAEMFVKSDLRAPFPASEAIIFAEHFNRDNMAKGEAGYIRKCDEARGFVFEPLRAYLNGERERAAKTLRECNEACGNQMAGHYFSKVQWMLPTLANYRKLQALFNSDQSKPEHLRRDYEDLRRDYEELRRPFNATPDAPYTDVWDFKTVKPYSGKHPCEKPMALIEHILRLSGRDDFTVLDPFAGSGQTLLAAARLGYKAIGGDIEQKWAERCAARLTTLGSL